MAGDKALVLFSGGQDSATCLAWALARPDCRDDTIKSLQVALNLGMDHRFVLHTPLMWIDKAATWRLAADLGGEALVTLINRDTHSCYRGDRSLSHAWGYGCGDCPACDLRADGCACYGDTCKTSTGSTGRQMDQRRPS